MRRIHVALGHWLHFRLFVLLLVICVAGRTSLQAAEAAPQKITVAELAKRMPELAKTKDRSQFTVTAKVAFVRTVPVPAFKNNDFDIYELSDGSKKVLIGFTYNKTVSPLADYQAKKEAKRALEQSLKKGGNFTMTISVSPFAVMSDAQPVELHTAIAVK